MTTSDEARSLLCALSAKYRVATDFDCWHFDEKDFVRYLVCELIEQHKPDEAIAILTQYRDTNPFRP